MSRSIEITDINTKAKMNDGRDIPLLGLGVFQSENGTECTQAVETALEAGYRHIDTATAYRNEESVGRGIANSSVPREEIFITTKFPPRSGSSNVRNELQKSLRLMGIDYVDLYLIHWPVSDYMASWEVLIQLREEGLCRSIGVSNYTVKRFEEDFFPASEVVPAVNQMEIHCFNQRRDLHGYCTEKGILMEAYSPLARAQRFDDPALKTVAENTGKSPAQVMIRYLMQKGIVTIPKSANPKRIRENAAVFDFQLDGEQMQRLNDLNDDNYYSLTWRPEGFY